MYGNDNGEELSLWDDSDCDNRLPYICHVKVNNIQGNQIKNYKLIVSARPLSLSWLVPNYLSEAKYILFF